MSPECREQAEAYPLLRKRSLPHMTTLRLAFDISALLPCQYTNIQNHLIQLENAGPCRYHGREWLNMANIATVPTK